MSVGPEGPDPAKVLFALKDSEGETPFDALLCGEYAADARTHNHYIGSHHAAARLLRSQANNVCENGFLLAPTRRGVFTEDEWTRSEAIVMRLHSSFLTCSIWVEYSLIEFLCRFTLKFKAACFNILSPINTCKSCIQVFWRLRH